MDTITVNGVKYIRKDSQVNDTRYTDLVETIGSELTMLRENAQSLYDDFLKNGFAVSTIEAEGYLRGIVTAENVINEQIRWSREGVE